MRNQIEDQYCLIIRSLFNRFMVTFLYIIKANNISFVICYIFELCIFNNIGVFSNNKILPKDFANMIIEGSDYFYTIDSIQRITRKTSKENRGHIEITPYTAGSNAIGSITMSKNMRMNILTAYCQNQLIMLICW